MDSKDVREVVRQALADLGVPGGSRIVVGLSGGIDSWTLLLTLQELGQDVIAAHLNHGQRSEAAQQVEMLGAECDRRGIPFVPGQADVPRLSQDQGVGLEEGGRWARYEFFERVAMAMQADFIATGHTRDDRLETVLFHLTRGTGPAGLVGIPRRRGRIIRPLLDIDRNDTREFAKEAGVPIIFDPSNEDLQFARARMRHRVVPELQTIHPGVRRNVARLADLMAEEDALLNGLAAAALEKAEIPLNGDLRFLTLDCEVAFDRNVLLREPPALVRRGLILAAQTLGGQFSGEALDQLVEGLLEEEKGSLTGREGAVVATWEGNRLHLEDGMVDEPFRYPLVAPGETESEVFGWTITVQTATGESPARPPRHLDVMVAARAAQGLHFRAMEAGDKMTPFGMDGHRLLSDMLSEAGLTPRARRRIPVICDLAGPIWVPGVAQSERTRVEGDEPSWRLTLAPLSPQGV